MVKKAVIFFGFPKNQLNLKEFTNKQEMLLIRNKLSKWLPKTLMLR